MLIHEHSPLHTTKVLWELYGECKPTMEALSKCVCAKADLDMDAAYLTLMTQIGLISFIKLAYSLYPGADAHLIDIDIAVFEKRS